MPLRHRFSELEVDALTELINIGMSSAAVSLGRLLRQEILLSVPAMSLVSPAEAEGMLKPQVTTSAVAVRQDFSGPLEGKALLIFPKDDSLGLVAVVEANLGLEDSGPDVWADALTETGNVVIQSCLSSLANLLLQRFEISQPQLVDRDVLGLVNSSNGAVLFLYVNFDVRGRRIRGFMMLLIDLLSLDELQSLIAQYIGRTV